ncbi:MAG: YchF family ATPase [Desulfurellaceae bacterium]|nr:YchF family ATPase [Desulfurellaceae bacterium]
MKLGLLGFPEVGKKTLLELLTGKEAGLVKGIGIAYVRDERFNQLVKMYKPKKTVPATLEFSIIPDIGEQNNTKIFQTMQDVDVLCYVARAFKDNTVFHIKGSIDSARDIEMANDELILNDLLFIEKRSNKLKKEFTKKSAQSKLNEEKLLLRFKQHLEGGKPLRALALSDEEEKLVKSCPFLTVKNMIVVLNVGEDDIADDKLLETLKKHFADQNMEWAQVSAKLEKEISAMESEEERQDFLKEMGIDVPALEKLTILSYKALGLITFFTVGKDEVRAWMIPQGSTAPEAARAVHTDMERGFIRAGVVKYNDLIKLGSEKNVKESGKYMLKGKDYIVEDGDILNFLFNV